MRRIFLALSLTLIGFTGLSNAAAGAKPKAPRITLKTIRSYESFAKLTGSQKELYLYGLQALMQDLSEQDATENTQYQSAQFRFQFLDAIFPYADAAGGDRRCVYAGSVSEMDVNGRYCLRPRDTGNCSPKITCNPLIYGSGKCAPSGKLATSTCQRSAKPFSEIAKELAGKKEEWTAFQSELSGYCASPRPTQKTVCGIIERRVAQIESVVGKTFDAVAAPEPTGTASAPAAAETVTAAPAPDAPAATTRIVAQPAEPDSIPVVRAREQASVKAPAAGGRVAAATGADSKCVSTALMAPMNGEGEPKEGFNLMTLWEAQQLMCFKDGTKVSNGFIAEIRRALAYRIAAVNRMPARARSYYRSNFTNVSRNFEACLNEAKRIQEGAPVNTSGRGATLQLQGAVVKVTPVDGLEGPNLAAINEQSISLSMYGFNVCKLQSNISDAAKPDRSARAFGTAPASR